MFGFFKKKAPVEAKPEPLMPLAPIPPKPASPDQKFAVALYHELKKVGPGNAFFSPYSISMALAMVQAGASGRAREEIETALGYPGAGDRLIDIAGKRSRELASRSEPTAVEKSGLGPAGG